MKDKLATKIKALLAKGSCKGVSEEEGKLFMDKAAELMAKHGLEMSDLPADAPERQLDIGRTDIETGRKREYDVAVGRILKKCFGVDVLHMTGKNHAFVIIGTPEDTEVVREVLPMLRATMSRGFLQWQRSKGITKWSSDEARAYYYGLATGYIEASDEGKARAMAQASKGQQTNYGLILVEKHEAIIKWGQLNIPGRKNMKSESMGSKHGAYADGFKQGATLKLIQPKKIK